MRKLYLSLLSVVVGMVFGLGFVKGDIIDSDWGGFENSSGEIDKSLEKTYYSSEEPQNLKLSLIPDSISSFLQLFLKTFFLVIIVVWGEVLILSLFVNIYENLTGKTKKYLIPSFKGMKKWLWVAFILFVFCIIIGLWIWFVDPSGGLGGQTDSRTGVTYYPPIYDNNIMGMISLGKDIICCISFLLLSLVVLFVYYRFFRKFGWNKLYSVLGTIFFPIGVCVLGFGNFKCQGENLEKKDEIIDEN